MRAGEVSRGTRDGEGKPTFAVSLHWWYRLRIPAVALPFLCG
jgi:hypothetical protein